MKIIKTLKLEDQGQDFVAVDIYDNGVIRGYSPLFGDDRLSVLGIGSFDGKEWYFFKELEKIDKEKLAGLYIYIKNTGEKDPLPWEAPTIKYKIRKNNN